MLAGGEGKGGTMLHLSSTVSQGREVHPASMRVVKAEPAPDDSSEATPNDSYFCLLTRCTCVGKMTQKGGRAGRENQRGRMLRSAAR